MLSALKRAGALGNGLATPRQLGGALHQHCNTHIRLPYRHITTSSSKLNSASGLARANLSGYGSAEPTTMANFGFLDHVVNKYSAPTAVKRNAADEWRMRSEQVQAAVGSLKAPDAYQGRSVPVFGGDVANAYRRLNTIMARNNVRRELSKTARHEKRGDKRRRLASQQWRTRFSHEVRKKVQLVQAIRRRSG